MFFVLLATSEAVLGKAHPHWPQSVLVGLSALIAVLVALVKPLVGAVTSWVSSQLTSELEHRALWGKVVSSLNPGRARLPRVRDLADPRAELGIHYAISLPEGSDTSLSPELPLYVTRDVDARVASWITERQRSRGFLLLVGPAGAGKTRCLYEALLAKVPDAAIFIPAKAEQIEAFVQVRTGRGPVVVWLDEIYDLLESGGLTADLVRRMLSRTRPVLIVATLWTQRFEALTQSEANELTRDKREILTKLVHTEHLTAQFSRAELERAKAMEQRDPRLREALAAGSADVTGILAARPRLMDYWADPPDPYAHAVLRAAVTAARCGHPDPIPAAVLEPVAGAILSPAQRAAAGAEWLAAAVEGACRPLLGLRIAPMEARSSTPGRVEGYSPHDILTQAVTLDLDDRDILRVIEHASPDACVRIGATPYVYIDKPQLAITATRKALAGGDPDTRPKAAGNLGILLAGQDDPAGARDAYQLAIDSGHPEYAPWAAAGLGILLAEQGDPAGARAAYQVAIDSGHTDERPRAADFLGDLLAEQGDPAGARAAYQIAIDSGHPDWGPTAAIDLGILLTGQDDLAGARAAYQLAIDSGHADERPQAA
ncbi:MAG TPA: tetratricopeptide repeat protein, partial [Streptosporangiaceae bacterium]|nr:tetratricopeptide repeat protein [Streptosporangiaceae bacterium]